VNTASTGPVVGEIQLVRQPVFDQDGRVEAYQLLARTETLLETFAALDEPSAAAKLLSDTFLQMDVRGLTGGLPAYLRVPAELLLRGVVGALPAELTVLELIGAAESTPELREACRSLRADGYRLALGGVGETEADAELIALMACVDVWKVDVGRVPASRQHQLVSEARRVGKRVVADNVDTRSQEAAARLLGFDAYQGRFFQQPVLVRGRRVAGSRAAHLQLLKAANAVEIDYADVAEVIKRDVALAWKFLNYINAALFGWRRRIESINQGLVLLGQSGVRRWVSLIVVTELTDNCPQALIVDAVCRARLCERIVERMPGGPSPLNGFLVGMFSLLDAMLDEPLADILSHVSLPDDVVEAILGAEGQLGMVLQLVVAYERGAWSAVEGRASALGLATAELTSIYLDALAWARTALDARDRAAC
jgi:EAL and modified HD-GYP domain-containing signal transduction protein